MNIEDAKQFIISRGKLPHLNEQGRQEFHWAVSEGRLDEVKAWLIVGMAVDTRHDDSFPIIRAAEGNNAEMVAFLTDQGADLNVRDSDGDTALHTAVNWTAEEALKMLIERKSPLNTSNNTGQTPLISALENNEDYVPLLLAAGADPNYGDLYGAAPVGFAAAECSECLQLLVKHGGDPNKIVKGHTILIERIIAEQDDDEAIIRLLEIGADPKLPNAFGWTPMMVSRVRDASAIREVLLEAGLEDTAPHTLVDLFEDRDDPDLDSIKHFLKEFDVDVKDEMGRTLLSTVAGSGDVEIVSYLLGEGADPNAAAEDGPLSLAACENHGEIIKLLLDAGAKPNNPEGHSPALSTAALMSATESVKLLLDAGANPSSHDEYFESALHQAIYEGPLVLIQHLLDAGADTNRFNHIQTSPLMYAIDQDRPNVVAALLAAGADVNLRDSHGKTALGHAVDRGYDYNKKLKKIIHLLLKAGADGKLASFSSTPYDNAKNNYEEIAEQILDYETTGRLKGFGKENIDTFSKQVDAYQLQLWITKDLDFAKKLIIAGAGRIGTVDTFSPIFNAIENQDLELLNLLLEAGFSPDAVNRYDESVLQKACERGHLEFVEVLLKAGADMNYIEPEFNTDALSYAVKSENIELVEYLLEKGADPNRMKAGWTPLWRATSVGNLEMVKVLLEAGVSKNVRTRQNKTAYEVAVEKGHDSIAEILQ